MNPVGLDLNQYELVLVCFFFNTCIHTDMYARISEYTYISLTLVMRAKRPTVAISTISGHIWVSKYHSPIKAIRAPWRSGWFQGLRRKIQDEPGASCGTRRLRTCSKNKKEGLPWWHSGWESACQCRGQGFEPWSGKIPHAAEQLGPWARITEPSRLEPVLHNKRGRDGERPAHHSEEWPPFATTGESPRTETKTQHSHK